MFIFMRTERLMITGIKNNDDADHDEKEIKKEVQKGDVDLEIIKM